jgi:hypothetical protein
MGLNLSQQEYSPARRPQRLLKVASYPGRVVGIIDLGVQERRAYEGKAKPPCQMAFIQYELSHEFLEDEEGNPDETKPLWLGEQIPLLSLKSERATSTKRCKTFDPMNEHNGDLTKMLASPCSILVAHSSKEGVVRHKIGDVGALAQMPGYVQPALRNPPRIFELSNPDLEVFNSLPEWMQTLIKGNLNYAGSKLEALLGEGTTSAKSAPAPEPETPAVDSIPFDDDIPF